MINIYANENAGILISVVQFLTKKKNIYIYIYIYIYMSWTIKDDASILCYSEFRA